MADRKMARAGGACVIRNFEAPRDPGTDASLQRIQTSLRLQDSGRRRAPIYACQAYPGRSGEVRLCAHVDNGHLAPSPAPVALD